MPLVLAAALAYAAGLLAGFGRAPLWMTATAALVSWFGAARARERIALAALGAAGLAIGTLTAATDANCEDRLLSADSWEVVLGLDAAPGDFVRAEHACGVTMRLAVREGSAAAGSRVLVRGEAMRGRWGLLITNAAVEPTRAPGVLPRWRAAIGRGIDARFGAHAPLVRALLIADMSELSPSVRERFAASGLSHMLSVSGLHVGLIAAAVMLLAQVAGLRRAAANVVIVLVTGCYVLVIGAPLPAVRAAAMLGIVALSQATQRPTSPWAALAAGGGLALLEPRSVLDLGYQLSIVGMVALVAAGALNKRWEAVGGGGWRPVLARGLVVSTIATLLTTPLVAATFGKVSFVAPVSNLAAAPIMAALQPMLFLAALLLPATALSQFVADACVPLLLAFDWIAGVAGRLPFASVTVLSDGTTTALACACGAALVVAMVSRFPGRALVAAALCLATIAWRPLVPVRNALTELHMLDVGQGDAVAIRTMRGRWLLVDAGRDWNGGDEGARQVVPYLGRRGGSLEAFVLSHPHSDHVGGAASVIAALRPRAYYDPGYAGGAESYRRSLAAAREHRAQWKRVRPGDSLVVDEVTVVFLAPDSAWAEGLRDPNDASAVALVRVGSVTMLLTGDAEAAEERWLLDHHRKRLDVDILKVAHHGSSTSSTDDFLDAVTPRIALVSVGAGNVYRHPSRGVLRALAAHGAVTLRTDRHGTIVLRTDGASLEAEAAGERWSVKP